MHARLQVVYAGNVTAPLRGKGPAGQFVALDKGDAIERVGASGVVIEPPLVCLI